MGTIEINWYAVLAATAVGFAVGFLWYGPLFGKMWMKEVGVDPETAQSGDMGKIFGYSAAFQFIMAYTMAMFLGSEVTAITGALYGLLFGVGIVAMSLSVNALYEQKSRRYMLINGGYWSVVFTLMGLIIGLWH